MCGPVCALRRCCKWGKGALLTRAMVFWIGLQTMRGKRLERSAGGTAVFPVWAFLPLHIAYMHMRKPEFGP